MNVNSSGGGYFYGPFFNTQALYYGNITPGVAPGTYGPWQHTNILSGRGRWIIAHIIPDALGSNYFIQLGIGAPGAEVIFQPNQASASPPNSPAFICQWDNVTPGAVVWQVPMTFSFPTSVGQGKDISIRCASTLGGGSTLKAYIYLFN